MIPIEPSTIDPERFWKFVQLGEADECWPWTGTIAVTGYGAVSMRPAYRIHLRAHRVAYVLEHGWIAEGLVLDHLCRNRRCCNPAHLEAVTNEENIARGDWVGIVAARRAATSCRHGHEYTDANTLFDRDGSRMCRTCLTISNRKYQAKKKAERQATREARLIERREYLRLNPTVEMSNSERNAIKTHCIHGHELIGDNLVITKSGKRRCRSCNNESARRSHARRGMAS